MKTFVLMKEARKFSYWLTKFVSSWVDPQGLCFVTNKAIQKPWVKDIKLMRNSPSQRKLWTATTRYQNLPLKWNKMVRKKLGRELTRTNPVGMFPWSSLVVSKTRQLSSPTGKKKYQSCTVPPGFLWVPWGCPRGRTTAMQMGSPLVLKCRSN